MTASKIHRQITGSLLVSVVLTLAGCVTVQDGPPKEKRDISQIPDAIPQVHDGELKDSPYTLNGITYTPMASASNYEEEGIASWYGTKFHGKRTANGEVYDLYGMTAAHKTLPLPSYVRVTNRGNGRSVVLRVNDRGPFYGNRVIDLSYAAAKKLGFADVGVANVKVEGIDVEAFAVRQQEEAIRQQRLYLQMAALKNYHNAQMLRRQISETIASEIKVVKGDETPEPLYRVRIGPVQTLKHLESLLEQLENSDFESPFLVYEASAEKEPQ